MKILIIEDDQELCELLRFHLNHEGYHTDFTTDGEEGLYYIQENIYDLVLLDRMLPHMNGIEIIKKARSLHIQTPVIMITALSSVDHRVEGLDAGADDYLVKPFSTKELFARIRALCRRPGNLITQNTITYHDLSLDPTGLSLTGPHKSCSLTKTEAQLAEIFLRHPDQPLERQLLLNKIWGLESDIEERNLDNYIYFLRHRIRSVGSTLEIKTIRSIGYILAKSHSL